MLGLEGNVFSGIETRAQCKERYVLCKRNEGNVFCLVGHVSSATHALRFAQHTPFILKTHPWIDVSNSVDPRLIMYILADL